MVTWLKRNSTLNKPIAKIGTDDGHTFGPVLKLEENGTIVGESEAQPLEGCLNSCRRASFTLLCS